MDGNNAVVDALRSRLVTEVTERNILRTQLKKAEDNVAVTKQYHSDATHARTLLQIAAENTQKITESQMSVLVTSALEGIFPDPYEFIVRFVQRRNHTECDLLFKKAGEEFSPIESSGGGPLDIASFALRIAFWCMEKNSPVIVLDEPFRFLSHNLRALAGQLLQRLSVELGLQFIIITHMQELLPYGDAVIQIKDGKVV
jgi:hypothetical protein